MSLPLLGIRFSFFLQQGGFLASMKDRPSFYGYSQFSNYSAKGGSLRKQLLFYFIKNQIFS